MDYDHHPEKEGQGRLIDENYNVLEVPVLAHRAEEHESKQSTDHCHQRTMYDIQDDEDVHQDEEEAGKEDTLLGPPREAVRSMRNSV